ncbi:MAG: hypothetical protein ACKOWF_10370 [Chloroflexota bacterium]
MTPPRERAFPVEAALDAIVPVVARFPPPSMFELARRGHGSLFEQVIGCVVSIRTLEEVSLGAALRLFALATDPEGVAGLGEARIAAAGGRGACGRGGLRRGRPGPGGATAFCRRAQNRDGTSPKGAMP